MLATLSLLSSNINNSGLFLKTKEITGVWVESSTTDYCQPYCEPIMIRTVSQGRVYILELFGQFCSCWHRRFWNSSLSWLCHSADMPVSLDSFTWPWERSRTILSVGTQYQWFIFMYHVSSTVAEHQIQAYLRFYFLVMPSYCQRNSSELAQSWCISMSDNVWIYI